MVEVRVVGFDMVKFSPNRQVVFDKTFTVEKYEIKHIPASEIVSHEDLDEFNKYLVLTFADGKIEIYRNSHCFCYSSLDSEEDTFDDNDTWTEDDFE